MKKANQIIWLIYMVLFVSCNSGLKKANNNISSDPIDENTKTELINSKDSIVPESEPTNQEIYSEEWKRDEIKAKLKYDPSTKKKNFNFKLNDNEGEVRIELYHVKDRIVTVEERIFDKDNDQLKLDVFDFTEDNDCISSTHWNKKEQMSYIYSMYWDSLIKYDVNCNQFELDVSRKQQIIESAKASLDSIMLHFPEFKYSFNWK